MSKRLTLMCTRYFMVGLITVAMIGCGGKAIKAGRKTGEVNGTITLNGQPLTGGTVCLTDEVDGDTAIGSVGADGKFTVKYRMGTQVPTGKYKVTVGPLTSAERPSPQELMKNPAKYNVPNPIPLDYRNPPTTKLSAEVKEGVNTLTLAMEGKS